jgi:competence protein ComEA
MKYFSKSMLLLAAAIIFPMAAFAGPVNINTADAATISAELQGVGLTKAQAIVNYRKAHGPFKSYEDLTLVKGIGARTVEINRANILFKSAEKKK